MYMVIPGLVAVVDDGSSETPSWVDASSGDGDGGQVNQEHCESDWKRSQDLQNVVYLVPISTN